MKKIEEVMEEVERYQCQQCGKVVQLWLVKEE